MVLLDVDVKGLHLITCMSDVHRSAGPRQGVAASTEFASSGVSEADLAALEDAIRDAVRERRSVYEGSKEMLLRLFK